MFDQDLQEYLRVILDKGFAGNALFLQQNAARRIDAWKLGANANDPVAQFFLGLCHAHDIAVPLNALESLRLIQQAAENGFAPAQTLLALQYEEGREVKRDLDEALRWYARSAEA